MLDFPASPSVGQGFVASNGGSWTWDGVKWVSGPPSGAIYLPLTGGTLTGNLAAPSLSAPDGASAPIARNSPPAGDNSLDLATTAWGNINAPAVAHGFKNKIRNGTFDVWQRGTSFNIATGAAAYTADGWIVASVGATLNVALSSTVINATSRSMVLTGAAGLTNCSMQQRIESYVAVQLAGRTVTVQFRIKNNTGAAITPQVQTYYPSALDNWTTPVVDIALTNLQTIPNGATAVVAYTFNVSANASLGYIILLSFGGALNGASNAVSVTEVDIRSTPGWPIGLCANPPIPELRPVGIELSYCQRYYQTGQMYLYLGAVNCAAGQILAYGSLAPVLFRAAPTLTISVNNNTNISSPTLNYSAGMIYLTGTTTAAGGAGLNANFTANADL